MSDSQIMDYNKLTEMIKKTSKGKGVKGFAKKLIYAIIILITLVGVMGSFTFVPLDMEAYAKFIPVLALFVIPLIISIGASSITDKIEKGNAKTEKIKINAIIKTNKKEEKEE